MKSLNRECEKHMQNAKRKVVLKHTPVYQTWNLYCYKIPNYGSNFSV